MKEGCVTVKLVKVLVVGSAGVGKTSLIKLLLDQDPPEERSSTGCLERSIRVIRVLRERGEDQEEKWNELPQEELDEMIAEVVPVLVSDLNQKKEKTKQTTFASHGENPNERSTEGDDTRESRKEDDRNESQDATMLHAVSATNTKDVIDTVDTVREKLTKLVSSVKSSERLLNMELIYLTDTGGQQAYWDLAPIFTRDTTATLFVHRLCDKLDDTPLNDVYERGERVGPSQKARITTAQAFKTMLQNLGCGKSQSKIIVVGTHKDLAGSCEETLEQKNQKFKEIASPHKIFHANQALKEVVFEVNTKSPSEKDKVKATKLKTTICKVNKTVKIPIWWFILQQVLEGIAKNRGMDILSKEDCIHASKVLGFNEAQLDVALEYFDKLNIFLYKPNMLKDVVFTNVQVPLDKLSELVHKRHQLQVAKIDPARAAGEPCPGEWEEFRDHGILCTSFLDEFPKHYVKGFFTKDIFLYLLKELLIVFKSSEDEYFFPAILDVKEDIEIPNSTEIAPLVVMFPNGWAPPGVFCCTVCHLMSQARWEIASKDIFRNWITFTKHRRSPSVTLIDKCSFFVICVNVDPGSNERSTIQALCAKVYSEVLDAVRAGLESTHKTECRIETGFLCPVHTSEPELHTASFQEFDNKKLLCNKDKKTSGILSPCHTVWPHTTGKQSYHSLLVHLTHSQLFMLVLFRARACQLHRIPSTPNPAISIYTYPRFILTPPLKEYPDLI